MLTRLKQDGGRKIYVSLIDREHEEHKSFTVYTVPVPEGDEGNGRSATVAEIDELFKAAVDSDRDGL